MSLHRRAAKRDASEPAIVELLKAAGCSVQPLSIPGGPDLLIGWGGAWNGLVEVKTGRAKLRPGQRQWHEQWRGAPVWTLRSVEDAKALVQTLRGKG